MVNDVEGSGGGDGGEMFEVYVIRMEIWLLMASFGAGRDGLLGSAAGGGGRFAVLGENVLDGWEC